MWHFIFFVQSSVPTLTLYFYNVLVLFFFYMCHTRYHIFHVCISHFPLLLQLSKFFFMIAAQTRLFHKGAFILLNVKTEDILFSRMQQSLSWPNEIFLWSLYSICAQSLFQAVFFCPQYLGNSYFLFPTSFTTNGLTDGKHFEILSDYLVFEKFHCCSKVFSLKSNWKCNTTNTKLN